MSSVTRARCLLLLVLATSPGFDAAIRQALENIGIAEESAAALQPTAEKVPFVPAVVGALAGSAMSVEAAGAGASMLVVDDAASPKAAVVACHEDAPAGAVAPIQQSTDSSTPPAQPEAALLANAPNATARMTTGAEGTALGDVTLGAATTTALQSVAPVVETASATLKAQRAAEFMGSVPLNPAIESSTFAASSAEVNVLRQLTWCVLTLLLFVAHMVRNHGWVYGQGPVRGRRRAVLDSKLEAITGLSAYRRKLILDWCIGPETSVMKGAAVMASMSKRTAGTPAWIAARETAKNAASGPPAEAASN